MNLIEGLGSLHESSMFHYIYKEVRDLSPYFCPFGCFSIFI